MTKPNKDFFVALLGLPANIFRVWVITLLWAWFCVPTFGLPPISVVTAWGMLFLVFAVRSFNYAEHTPVDAFKDQDAAKIVAHYVSSGIFLAFG